MVPRVAPAAAGRPTGIRTLRGNMGGEAVTTTGRTSKTTALSPSPAGISCENWTGTPPTPLPCAAPSSAPAGLGHALAAALTSSRARRRGPARPRRGPAAPTSSCCASPTPRSQAAAAALTPADARFVGHCSGATTLAPLAGREAFSLHPLMTVPRGRQRRPFARRRARAIAGSTAAALRVAQDARRRPPHAPRRGRRRRPRRLPRRRVDRRQLPRHARGRRRAARRHRRRPPRAARPARPRRARELGGQGRRAAPSPAPSPAATRPRSRASARRSRSARPTCSTPSMLSSPPPG